MRVFLTMQRKGGVGKSLTSFMLLNYLVKRNGTDGICVVNTDGVNNTIAQYIDDERIDVQDRNFIGDDGIEDVWTDNILNFFDELFEGGSFDSYSDIIIDNGTNSFLPMITFLREYDLDELPLDFIFVVPIGGGPEEDTTIRGLSNLIENFKTTVKYLVVLNQNNGKTTIYEDERNLIESILGEKYLGDFVLPAYQKRTGNMAKALQKMCEARLLYPDLRDTTELTVMTRSALVNLFGKLFEEIDKTALPATMVEEESTTPAIALA